MELAPQGFEEVESGEEVELAAYGEAAERLLAEFGDARATEVEPGWEDRWREFHRPVQVGPLWIGPPWEVAPAGALTVVIDPGRAFGTGAHATTQLCVKHLFDQPRGSLLDVGCGSGVLAIAAARLGFAPLHAVDLEPASVQAARTNAAANGVALVAAEAGALTDRLPDADLVVANIAFAAVVALGPRLRAPRVITSGYLERDEPVLDGYERTARRTLAGWAADVHVRR